VSVNTTYPGIYIEELPSSSHAVTAAPTSVTVFVGYTNPFYLGPGPGDSPPPWGKATEITSFSDYVTTFGGFFTNPWLPDLVGQAVFQFFQNGGSDAYVVALQATEYLPAGTTPVEVAAPTASLTDTSGAETGDGFTFTALQPVGSASEGLTMTASISNITTSSPTAANPTPTAGDTADLTIVYGTAVETYRRLQIASLVSTVNTQSRLVRVAATATALPSYANISQTATFAYPTAPPAGSTLINSTAFPAVFEANDSLDKVSVFNLLAIPGITDTSTLAAALAFCEAKRAFFIMDPPANAVADTLAAAAPGAPAGAATIADIWNGAATGTPAPPKSQNGALYFPYLNGTDRVTGAAITIPPSGFVAGIFAKEDSNRGVWKSPAGLETTILGTTGVVPSGAMTDPQQGELNPLGINCIRTFPGIGSVVFGARTLVSANPAYQQWKYVAVRRMALFIEQSLYSSLLWAIFEPNDTPLWNTLRLEVSAFMLGLFRQGAFAGTTADQAFQVQCDATTTSATDIAAGRVNILVSFAPLSPAEFVVIQIAQLAGQGSS